MAEKCRACWTLEGKPEVDPKTYLIGGRARRRIPLTQGQYALVDSHNYDRLMKFNYYAHWSPLKRGFYALRSVCAGGQKSSHVAMAHDVIAVPRGWVADHINPSETLNNCEDNLRPATYMQNAWNRKGRPNTRSGLKGVSVRNDGLITACIRAGKITLHLGEFESVEDAHEAYKRAALELHGEFARFS